VEAVRDDEQSPLKAGRTSLPQGRLSEVSGLLTVACLFTAAGGYMDALTFVAQNTSLSANWIERGPPI